MSQLEFFIYGLKWAIFNPFQFLMRTKETISSERSPRPVRGMQQRACFFLLYSLSKRFCYLLLDE
jgi:hypothetical protein